MTRLNAKDYVQGLLDATYLGQFDDTYLALVDLTEEEAEAAYLDGLQAEWERFSQYFLLAPDQVSDETADAFLDFLAQLYARARFSADYATASDSGAYLVEVSVQPLCYFPTLLEDLPALRAQFEQTQAVPSAENEPDAAQPISTELDEEAWAQQVLSLCEDSISLLEYGEPVTITVRLTADEAGRYGIGAQDFYNLDALILRYTW